MADPTPKPSDRDSELKRKLDKLSADVAAHQKAAARSRRAAEETRQEVEIEREERAQGKRDQPPRSDAGGGKE